MVATARETLKYPPWSPQYPSPADADCTNLLWAKTLKPRLEDNPFYQQVFVLQFELHRIFLLSVLSFKLGIAVPNRRARVRCQ